MAVERAFRIAFLWAIVNAGLGVIAFMPLAAL